MDIDGMMQNWVIVKVAVGVVVFIVAVISSTLFNRIFKRWSDRYKETLHRKSPAEAASFDTRISIIRKIINVCILVLAVILFLLQFPAVRNIGTGLLASAGVAGLVIGMAAQNTLSNIIAGISISFAQPVRLNDAVIFEKEWGTVEEISLMQTIIKTWDNRRIIVPNNVLANRVIQNWTISDPSLLGVVMMYVDYDCDVEKVKTWVREIVDESPYSTDERVAVVQVVDFTEKTMVLRVLGKGADSANTWNLRCEIREKLNRNFRQAGLSLPLIRVKTSQNSEGIENMDETTDSAS